MRSRSLLEERPSPPLVPWSPLAPLLPAAGFEAVHRTLEDALTDLESQLEPDDLPA